MEYAIRIILVTAFSLFSTMGFFMAIREDNFNFLELGALFAIVALLALNGI